MTALMTSCFCKDTASSASSAAPAARTASSSWPYEVFVRSPRFLVYTVSANQPTAMLSGGLAVVPDYSLGEVDAGTAPAPDVIVVPAVVAPTGKKEAPLRQWISAMADRRAHILGVCNGARLLAATGLLDGRPATSHWSALRSLQRRHPKVVWERGQRYVQDGKVTNTAGVTSGVFGALRLVEQLAGAAEAQRVGRELAYPGWVLDGPTGIPVQHWAPRDLASLLALAFPWRRPTIGAGLLDGAGELDIAAPFELYGNSFAAHTVPIAANRTITTRHGLRLVATPSDATTPDLDRLIVPGAHTTGEVRRDNRDGPLPGQPDWRPQAATQPSTASRHRYMTTRPTPLGDARDWTAIRGRRVDNKRGHDRLSQVDWTTTAGPYKRRRRPQVFRLTRLGPPAPR